MVSYFIISLNQGADPSTRAITDVVEMRMQNQAVKRKRLGKVLARGKKMINAPR